MATNFPTSLDNFTNPVSGNTLDSPSHSGQHSDINDAVEAIETKLGVGASSAGSAVAGQVLTISTAGTSAWTTPTAGGLTQVIPTSVAVGSGSGSVSSGGAVTFSSVSSISMNGPFTSTYQNYRIIINCTNTSTTLNWLLKMRLSGTDNSASYNSSEFWVNNSGSTGVGSYINNGSFFQINTQDNANSGSAIALDIYRPFDAASTNVTGLNYDASSGKARFFGGVHNVSTAYDGFTILANTGTISGTIRIYGYKNG